MSDKVAYLASGVLSINSPLSSARTEAEAPAAPAAIGAYSVYTTEKHPNTGNLIEGFQWDARYWFSDSRENYSQYLPTNWDPTVSGLTSTYFQSGMGSGQDLQLDHIEFLPSSGLFSSVDRPWVPVVNHGYYYDYDEEAYLYSDDSEVVYLSRGGVVSGISSTYNKVALLSVPKVGTPITAVCYLWNNDEGKYYIDRNIHQITEFTGQKNTDMSRQTTWSDAKRSILWDALDTSNPEFVVVDSGLTYTIPDAIFNDQYCDVYPSANTFDVIGISTGGSNQQFHLTHAPIDWTMPLDIRSYATPSGDYQGWIAIPTNGDFVSVHSGVKVDYDLGILQFGDSSFAGVLVPTAGHYIAVRYYRSLRVEYEPQYLTDLVTGQGANLNPIYRTSGQGFVYLSTRADDPVTITLSASAPKIQTNLFGPVYIGNSYVPVIATVVDAQGEPVESAAATIFITSTPAAGRFGSLGESATVSTNHLGQGKAFYNPPLGINDIGELVTADNYSRTDGGNKTTLHVSNLLLQGDAKDIFVYQVWTDDASQGWRTAAVPSDDTSQQKEFFRRYFLEEGVYGPTGLLPGSGQSLYTTGSYTSADWEAAHRYWWDLTQLQLFSTTATNARKVLCATYDGNAYNPHTFLPGAVVPFQPSGVSGNSTTGYDIIFDTTNTALPIPSGSYTVGASGIIYGYFIVAPTTVSMQASVYNARLNTTFYSNTIELKLEVPIYLNGMWYIDALNKSNYISEISPMLASGVIVGSGVPFGFRLRSSTVTLASALNGVTFLDVNPTASGEAYWAHDRIVASGGYIYV